MTLEKYETICWDYDILPGQQICRNCTRKLFNQTEPKEEEVEILQQNIQVNDIYFEFATDFANQWWMMMNCFYGMVDWWKGFSLISNLDHCQRSSP